MAPLRTKTGDRSWRGGFLHCLAHETAAVAIGPVRFHGGDVCGRLGVTRVRPLIHTKRTSRIVHTAEPSGYHACSSPGVASLGKQPDQGLCGAACRNRTDDLLITSEMYETRKFL